MRVGREEDLVVIITVEVGVKTVKKKVVTIEGGV